MNRRNALRSLAGLALCPICASRSFAAEGAHWSYEGGTGPDKWGDLDPADQVCSAGSQQSPLDIGATIKSRLSPLRISWSKRADTIVNNGHTIQANFAEGSTLTVGSEKYTLLQFHFHRPSEHLINGKSLPMEAHFVHRNVAGVLAVIGVLMTTGKANPVFNKVVSTMPATEGPPGQGRCGHQSEWAPAGQARLLRLESSLTTPPCSEIVNWLLLTDTIQVADADVASFAKLYAMNARPAQRPNRRFVLQSG
jgi:carbonic anhydrase